MRYISLQASLLRGITALTTYRAPLSFFSNTDVGILMNHFSEDMQLFDMTLPLAALNTTACKCFNSSVRDISDKDQLLPFPLFN